ncbi:DinB family protein [Streptomyces sp. NBC_00249]|uniref:DinB family protein n=1 Tax=Streptomyces sp. NBC_00249 TaxID=2975690 RepID=UPI002253240A|nr:DinB family protein [Streptomyces sp. NBC_00249]MCX5194587.1 DinB family protein [Streptomyces sp. NBC_00249]
MIDRQGLARRMFGAAHEELTALARSADPADLGRVPLPGANSPAWLLWHVARGEDRNLSEIAGLPQLYVDQGWAARFGRPADPRDTGYGHTPAQAAAFTGTSAPGVQPLLGYLEAVLELRVEAYLASAPDGDGARTAPSPTLGTAETVEARLAGQLADSLAHLGQLGLLLGAPAGPEGPQGPQGS